MFNNNSDSPKVCYTSHIQIMCTFTHIHEDKTNEIEDQCFFFKTKRNSIKFVEYYRSHRYYFLNNQLYAQLHTQQLQNEKRFSAVINSGVAKGTVGLSLPQNLLNLKHLKAPPSQKNDTVCYIRSYLLKI